MGDGDGVMQVRVNVKLEKMVGIERYKYHAWHGKCPRSEVVMCSFVPLSPAYRSGTHVYDGLAPVYLLRDGQHRRRRLSKHAHAARSGRRVPAHRDDIVVARGTCGCLAGREHVVRIRRREELLYARRGV